MVEAPPPPPESSQTSHLSVIDGAGNAVSLTTTVNYFFGSCVVVPGAGFVLNDQMDDFDAAPGVPNAYGAVGTGANAPGAREDPALLHVADPGLRPGREALAGGGLARAAPPFPPRSPR